jgi:hypothetical protein
MKAIQDLKTGDKIYLYDGGIQDITEVKLGVVEAISPGEIPDIDDDGNHLDTWAKFYSVQIRPVSKASKKSRCIRDEYAPNTLFCETKEELATMYRHVTEGRIDRFLKSRI